MTSEPLVRMEPRTVRQAAEMAADAAAAGSRIALAGGGTHTAPGADATDGVLSTLGLREIVEYAAEDQTVTVEAGITLAALCEVLAANQQRLVLDLAEPERSTLGGAIAANAFGPRRMRYGSLKDLILGVTLVRADGTVARAGGKVVKNVAGFDLSKLVVGSYGSLALVTTATLRVHPLPEKLRGVRSTGLSASAIWETVLAIRKRQLEPAALVATRSGTGDYALDVLFEGFAAGVDAQIDAFAALASVAARQAEEIDWDVASAADRNVRRGGPLRVRCTFRPSDLAEIDRSSIAPIASVLDRATVAVYPALGVAFVAGEARDAGPARDALSTARAELERRGGSLVIEALPEASNGTAFEIDTWGTPPPSFGLMRQLKARFDPERRLNPGCFVGGI